MYKNCSLLPIIKLIIIIIIAKLLWMQLTSIILLYYVQVCINMWLRSDLSIIASQRYNIL